LSFKNLTDYIFDPEDRHTLIDQNKEGIFSTIGYVSIYLAGEALCYKLNYLLKEKYICLFYILKVSYYEKYF